MNGFKPDVEHFRARVLQDALNEGSAIYWLRRARDLAKGLHRPGDFPGGRTPEELALHNQFIYMALENVRQHVSLLRDGDVSEEIWAILAEVGA